jgi:hypothetical protein
MTAACDRSAVRHRFPAGSIRRAVAVMGDNWGMQFEPSELDVSSPNHVFRCERHDDDVMRRCGATMDRGSIYDPRVWVGVPLTERAA